ncbi:hypothetical protein [Arthrobacter sp. H20]|uniref:hypothetical protein n=1 Tax=Arthrobacter sp. H20 TaxID=1267981 RepID=UPI00047D1CBE|nr:hypothetical protein [Arthrobacter sp. H20]
MKPLGNQKPAATGAPAGAGRGLSLRMGTIGMSIMLIVFLVAVVFAANQNDVVGWLVAIISLGWLLIFSFVVFSLRTAARNAAARINEAQQQFNRANGIPDATTTGVVDEATLARDMKLDHSFKIVQVQVRVIRDHLVAGKSSDEETVGRALETIEITSHNARSMMKKNDDGPVEGTVVD